MWSSPGSRPKRGTVKDTRRVRQSPKPERKPAIKRPGKIRGALIDAHVAAGGPIDVDVLGGMLHRKHPRDLFRRKRPNSKGRDGLAIWLIDAGILSYDGKRTALTEDWRERLDDVRRAGGEIDSHVVLTRPDGVREEHLVEGAETIALRRLDLKRKAYHRRHRVEPDHHYANVGADGYIEDLQRDDVEDVANTEGGPEVSPLAAAVRDYLERSPKDACEPVGWIGSTLWALDLFDGKPTPRDVRGAIDELGGESYLRERLEASRGAA